MRDALQRSSPDAARQAAHSARELFDQLLKIGAPPECTIRDVVRSAKSLGEFIARHSGNLLISAR